MIEVGEYGRTNLGNIIKFAWLQDENGIREKNKVILVDLMLTETRPYYYFKKDEFIVKHSKNIIDLIEDEDIVILEYKTPKYRERIERKFIVCKIDDFINFENRNCNFTYKVGDKKIVDKICKNIKIKGILTTEQFNNEYYRLEK